MKHGGRGSRNWNKIHLGINGSGVIVAHAPTDGYADDATTATDPCPSAADLPVKLTARHAPFRRETSRSNRPGTDVYSGVLLTSLVGKAGCQP